jgi:ABC-2 type transport system permease protein
MKILSLLKKNIILQIRDYWALLITVLLGPFFVFIYWLLTAGFPSFYNVLVVNNDKGEYGNSFIEMCQTDQRIFETMHLKLISTVDSGKQILKKRDADAMIVFSEDFSHKIENEIDTTIIDTIIPNVHFYGEKSNTRYLVGVITSYTAIDAFIKYLTNAKEPWKMEETFIDEEKIKRSDFDLQIPGILILSIIMLIFSAGMLIIRDIEDKSLQRLKLTKMTIFDYISGVTLTQVLVGVISVISTYILATMFGFQSLGSMSSVIIICMVAFIGVIGVTFIVVSFCKNATIFVLAGQVPLFILIFFSGAMMPIPRNPLFHILGNGICWNDLLPVGMTVISLNSVFNDGKSIFELNFQLIFSLIISATYLIIGLYLFNKKHLKLKG